MIGCVPEHSNPIRLLFFGQTEKMGGRKEQRERATTMKREYIYRGSRVAVQIGEQVATLYTRLLMLLQLSQLLLAGRTDGSGDGEKRAKYSSSGGPAESQKQQYMATRKSHYGNNRLSSDHPPPLVLWPGLFPDTSPAAFSLFLSDENWTIRDLGGRLCVFCRPLDTLRCSPAAPPIPVMPRYTSIGTCKPSHTSPLIPRSSPLFLISSCSSLPAAG